MVIFSHTVRKETQHSRSTRYRSMLKIIQYKWLITATMMALVWIVLLSISFLKIRSRFSPSTKAVRFVPFVHAPSCKTVFQMSSRINHIHVVFLISYIRHKIRFFYPKTPFSVISKFKFVCSAAILRLRKYFPSKERKTRLCSSLKYVSLNFS